MHKPRAHGVPPWLKRLGGRIRQARRARGLTQRAAAGPQLTKSFVSLLESGRTYPSVTTLVALTDRLQTSLAMLLLDETQLPREAALSLLALVRAKAAEFSGTTHTDTLLAAVDVLADDADDLCVECLLARGDVAFLHGKGTNAVQWFEEALGQARRRHQRACEPRAVLRLAECALHRNDGSAARTLVVEAITLFRATRTLRSADGYEALILQSRLMIQAGKFSRALRILNKITDTAARHDMLKTQGKAQRWIGLAHAQSGRPDLALEALRQARDAFRNVGENAEFAQVLLHLGKFSRDAGKLDEAQASFEQALRIQERGHIEGERAVILNEVAQLQIRRNQLAEALRTAKKGYALARSPSDHATRGRILVTIAQIARMQRRWKQAAAHLREAVELFRKAKLSKEFADTARELGMLLRERGEHAEASHYLAITLSAERTER